MVGLDPIRNESIKHFEKEGDNSDNARKMAVKEYLAYNLGFDDDKLAQINIIDTKQAAKDDLVYFVVEEEDLNKEIYYHRAMSGNYLIVQDYIPLSIIRDTWPWEGWQQRQRPMTPSSRPK